MAASLVLVPLACGSSTRGGGTPGGAGNGHNAGGSGSGNSGVGGNASSGNSASGSTLGGTGAASSAGTAAGGGSDAGTDSSAAGEGGEASTAPINTDFSWALWPMPNTLDSGLPHPLSYDTSIDGIVIDNVTGLIWQKERAPFEVEAKDAVNVCKALNVAGHTDWRLPSRIELLSLLANEPQSIVDTKAFTPSVYGQGFWSSSPVALTTGSLWVWGGTQVFQSSGEQGRETCTVRCVRSLPRPAPTTPHYLVQTDVVQDTWTGLWWERTPLSQWREFGAAKAYCDNLTLGGFSDWYFPSIKEMLTIVDEHRAWPALDTQAFPGPEDVVSGWTWSSTLFPETDGLSPRAFATRFGDGFTWTEPLPGGWLTRCARQDQP